MTVNAITGEVDDWEAGDDPTEGVLLPTNLADLEDDAVAQAFPTPVEIEAGLVRSRTRIGRSVRVIKHQVERVRVAKRALLVARASARQDARAAGGTEKDIAAAIDLDDTVREALAEVDDAAVALEYARQLKSGLYLDVEILRSLNSNVRSEMGRR